MRDPWHAVIIRFSNREGAYLLVQRVAPPPITIIFNRKDYTFLYGRAIFYEHVRRFRRRPVFTRARVHGQIISDAVKRRIRFPLNVQKITINFGLTVPVRGVGGYLRAVVVRVYASTGGGEGKGRLHAPLRRVIEYLFERSSVQRRRL